MKTKKIFQNLLVLAFILPLNLKANNTNIKDLPSNEIRPQGWAQEFLNRQITGLTGHPEESGFPFNTNMWDGTMDVKQDEFQYYRSPWWPYEHTAYYLDGALRCAYLTDNQNLINRVQDNIDYVLSHADKDGRLHAGNIGITQEWWPMVVFMRMLLEKYECTKDPKLLKALENHFKAVYKNEDYTIPSGAGFSIRIILQVEPLCKLYGITKDKWFLNAAENLYKNFQTMADRNQKSESYQISAHGMAKEIKSTGHGVTYHEFLKLPAILYKYTGKEEYKKAIYGGFHQLEKNHELADGLSSCCEPFAGKASNLAHETCNVIDYNWTAGWALLATEDPYFADKMEKVLYNAGFSSLTSDFRAHQYFSMPNLLIATGMSSSIDDNHPWGLGSKGRMSYKPGHDTQCCSGNIHRMFPTFLNRMCLTKKDNVKLVFYLPSTVNIPINNELFSFTQKTNYPFEHSINILINSAPNKKIDFGFRIPGWADSYTIKLNNNIILNGTENTIFKSLHKKFKRGDKIEIKFNTTPKIQYRSNGKGIAINFGPLVFSQPIEAKERIIVKDYAHKCSENFPAYEYYPMHEHNWAVALPRDLKNSDIEVVNTSYKKYPWQLNASPIELKVKGKEVLNWDLERWLSPSNYPETVTTGKNLTLDLQPMGSTLLRITEIPTYK